MSSVFNAIYATWNQIIYAVSNIRFFDILDIIIIAFIIYKTFGFLRDSRAGQLVKGLLILVVVYLIANWWELATLKWILTKVMNSAIIAAAVIFQPELRKILENVGRTKFTHGQLFDKQADDVVASIDMVCKAASYMQKNKIGALIVFERMTQLGDITSTGTVLDANPSVSVINNIFFPNSPLHDGAVVVRSGRIYAAGCILPLTQREDLNSQLGTRHRAAIGITENSDAVVLVVSEETGIISIVTNGQISRNYNSVTAVAELRKLLITDDNKEKTSSFLTKIKNFKLFNKKERNVE